MPLLVTVLLVLATVGWFVGRNSWSQWARNRAVRCMAHWAICDALDWLDRSDALRGEFGENHLLRATCYRHLGQEGKRAQSLALAEEHGAPSRQIAHELLLGKIQSGELLDGAENHLPELTEAGISPNDIAAALVLGCLVKQQLSRAEAMLNAWSMDMPREPHVSYVRGVLCQRTNRFDEALKWYQKAITDEPRHELAQLALASVRAQTSQLDQALASYTELADRYPRNERVLVGLASVLRKRGSVQAAQSVLEGPAADSQPSCSVALEMGQIEFELGHYENATLWLKKVATSDIVTIEGLSVSVNALALAGRNPEALRIIGRAEQAAGAIRRMQEVQVLLALDPSNVDLNSEFRRLIHTLATELADRHPFDENLPAIDDLGDSPSSRLYARHCAHCHGDTGDGKGRAARHIFPRPRDLRDGRMRLVSTQNGVPTLNDLQAVIKVGMPGTSMPAYDDLEDHELSLLAETVVQMQRDGARERLERELDEAGETVNPAELADIVADFTTPGEVVTVPPISPASAESIGRGRAVYVQNACESCHGTGGEGDTTMPLFDESDNPVVPTDLTVGLLKGGNKPESIYLRVLVGMPGSPHPANVISTDQLIDLVHFVKSLERRPEPTAVTNHQRALEAYRRSIVTP